MKHWTLACLAGVALLAACSSDSGSGSKTATTGSGAGGGAAGAGREPGAPEREEAPEPVVS